MLDYLVIHISLVVISIRASASSLQSCTQSSARGIAGGSRSPPASGRRRGKPPPSPGCDLAQSLRCPFAQFRGNLRVAETTCQGTPSHGINHCVHFRKLIRQRWVQHFKSKIKNIDFPAHHAAELIDSCNESSIIHDYFIQV